MVGEPLVARSLEAPPAGLTDGIPSSFVLVVRRDVADTGVEPDRVVLVAHPAELVLQQRRVADALQVPPLALHVTEEGLDPRLVGRRVRASVVLATAIVAMNALVASEVIWGPLSETARRPGRRGSSPGSSRRSG